MDMRLNSSGRKQAYEFLSNFTPPLTVLIQEVHRKHLQGKAISSSMQHLSKDVSGRRSCETTV